MTESPVDPLIVIDRLSEHNNAAVERVRSARRESEMANLDAVYPQWRQVVASEMFDQWLGRQSRYFRELGQSPLAIDVIRLLDCFMRENAQTLGLDP